MTPIQQATMEKLQVDVDGLLVRDKNNYELITAMDVMVKNLCSLLGTSYPPSHRPEGDSKESLQNEAAALIQVIVDGWDRPSMRDGSEAVRQRDDYVAAYQRWNVDRALDEAWGLIANAFGGDWDRCTDVWKSRARDWERRRKLFEGQFDGKWRPLSSILAQAALLAAKPTLREFDLMKNRAERAEVALANERAVNTKLLAEARERYAVNAKLEATIADMQRVLGEAIS